jgi:hypothetical protein
MSQGAMLDKIAPVGYEPNLQLEESDCDAVESLSHDPRLYTRPARVGHEYRDSGDVRLEKTQRGSGWVVSVGR